MDAKIKLLNSAIGLVEYEHGNRDAQLSTLYKKIEEFQLNAIEQLLLKKHPGMDTSKKALLLLALKGRLTSFTTRDTQTPNSTQTYSLCLDNESLGGISMTTTISCLPGSKFKVECSMNSFFADND